jgi:hypothetical protein
MYSRFRVAFDGDRAAMFLDELFDNPETKSGPTLALVVKKARRAL